MKKLLWSPEFLKVIIIPPDLSRKRLPVPSLGEPMHILKSVLSENSSIPQRLPQLKKKKPQSINNQSIPSLIQDRVGFIQWQTGSAAEHRRCLC